MFRDLARTTAALKGKRYEGAVIAAARWRRGRFECQIGMPEIQKGRHGLCVLRAADESGELMLTLLLGRPAPQAEAGQPPRVLQAVARGQGIRPSACSLRFSEKDVQAFVRDVNDTNPLHEGRCPLVPGLLILETLLKQPELRGCMELSLKFTTPSFAGETIHLEISAREEQNE